MIRDNKDKHSGKDIISPHFAVRSAACVRLPLVKLGTSQANARHIVTSQANQEFVRVSRETLEEILRELQELRSRLAGSRRTTTPAAAGKRTPD